MTPFEFDILLWYVAHAIDHDVVRDDPPIWRETCEKFFRLELLELEPGTMMREPGTMMRTYRLTERGLVFVNAALSTPLPVRRWVMPEA